jgi:glutamate dehydrogenase
MMAAATLRSPITPGLALEADLDQCDSFPTYTDPFEDSDDTFTEEINMSPSASPASSPLSASQRLSEKAIEDPSRHASPQPTSVSVPALSKTNGNGYRVLRSATVGYIAPEFKGKLVQMSQGK